MAPFGYQWFSLQDRTESVILEGGRGAAAMLSRFMDDELAKNGRGDDGLELVGFSQGTSMSLYVALRRDRPVAGILGYSGKLVGPDLLPREIRCRPPVMLIHGEIDPILPFEAMAAAEQVLKDCGVAVETMARPGLGHGIDEEGVRRGLAFLKTCFGV
jgi:phospholipase/carboxylesterase